MKLTDDDVAAIRGAHNRALMTMEQSDLVLRQIRGACLLAGEDMRERAAKALTQVYDSDRPYDERTIDACLTVMRALGVDDD